MEASVSLIRLLDGTLVDPLTREPIQQSLQSKKSGRSEKEAPDDDPIDDDDDTESNAFALAPLARRSIMDLSLNAQQMAVINNVLVYSIWGLPDDEIAIQCNCTTRHVAIVRDLDDYKRMHQALIEGLRSAYASTVEGIFAEAAPKAARGMVKKLKHKSPDISIAATKDVLDRAGFRPADKVEHTHSFGNGSELVIRVIRQNDADAIPTLDLNADA